MQQLSKDFTLEEFLYSETTQRYPNIAALQKKPPTSVVDCLSYLATTSLQKIADTFDFPITVSSGYRCLQLNRLVGSSDTSQHVLGQAADISIPNSFLSDAQSTNLRTTINTAVKTMIGKTIGHDANANYYLFVFCALHLNDLDIDQLICEYGEIGQPAWVHVSASKSTNRRQILLINHDGTKLLTLKQAIGLV